MSAEKTQKPLTPTKEWLRANGLFLEELADAHETFNRENVLRYQNTEKQDAFDEGIKEGIYLALRFLSTGSYRCSRNYDQKLKAGKSSTRVVGVSLYADDRDNLADQYFEYINNFGNHA